MLEAIETGGYDIEPRPHVLEQRHIDKIDQLLLNGLIRYGVRSAVVVDMAGNIVAMRHEGKNTPDMHSLASLASANYAVVDTMAKYIGENEFSLMFHKGKYGSAHFTKINDYYLLITIFGENMQLGMLRLKVDEITRRIRRLWD